MTVVEQLAEAMSQIERLRAERDAIKAAYWKMRNAAAGYSNFCDYDSASVRRCEQDYEEGERMYLAAIDAARVK